jgi:hypothetical protein
METWENSFKLILYGWQSDAVFSPTTSELEDLAIVLFTEEEVEGMIARLKDQEIAGPDRLYVECLKASKIQLLHI